MGVDVRIHEGKARLTPRRHELDTLPATYYREIDLPLIPAALIEWGGRLLRQVIDGDHAIPLLYLDMFTQQ